MKLWWWFSQEVQQSLVSTVCTKGHWGNMLWVMDSVNSGKDLAKLQAGYKMKNVQSGFLPSASKFRKKYSFSYFHPKIFLLFLWFLYWRQISFWQNEQNVSDRTQKRNTKKCWKCLWTETTKEDVIRNQHIKKQPSTVPVKLKFAEKLNFTKMEQLDYLNKTRSSSSIDKFMIKKLKK